MGIKKLFAARDMTQGAPWQRILEFSIPMLIGNVAQQLYNTADSVIVGKFVGDNALAAVGSAMPILNLLLALFVGIATGAGIVISQSYGARDREGLSKSIGNCISLAFIASLVIMVVGPLLTRPMLELLGTPDSILDWCTAYLKIQFFGIAGFFFYNMLSGVLRGLGDSVSALGFLLLAAALNVVLDLWFVAGFDMGVAGASLATAISKTVSFCILIFPYITRRSLLHLSIRNFRPTREIISEIVTVGSSSMFRNGLAVVAGILLNTLAGNISDSVLAGIGVCTKIMMFPFSIILGFGNGFQPVAGFNWGAKRYDRVKESYRFSSKVAFWGGAVMAAICILFADKLIVLFAGTDEEMRRIGAFAIITQSVALPIHAWVAIVNMYCVGLGNAKGALALSTARQGSCFLPILYPMAWLFKAWGVGAVQAAADILSLLLAIPIIRGLNRRIKTAMSQT